MGLTNASHQFQQSAVWASLGTSLGFTLLLAAAFSFLRPYNSIVYAPKLKHADDRHAPPPMGKGMFAWFTPVVRTKEQELILQVGLDATVFLRFTRMCRNMFLVLSIAGCGILIPMNLAFGNTKFNLAQSALTTLTPTNTYGTANWGQVACAWIFDLVVMAFLFFNYRAIVKLRRQYFDSPEYQASLHARTLMVNNCPVSIRSSR